MHDIHLKEHNIMTKSFEQNRGWPLYWPSRPENGMGDIISTRSKIFQVDDVEDLSIPALIRLIEEIQVSTGNYFR